MDDTKKREFAMRITNSNRSGLVVILYEMLFEYLTDAKTAMQNADFEETKTQLRHADDVLKELCDSLNFQYAISGNLFAIYTYCRKNLARAIYQNRPDGILETSKRMHELYEAFCEVQKQDTSLPLMQHAQKIVAGMTYGRGHLNESIQDPQACRGFLA